MARLWTRQKPFSLREVRNNLAPSQRYLTWYFMFLSRFHNNRGFPVPGRRDISSFNKSHCWFSRFHFVRCFVWLCFFIVYKFCPLLRNIYGSALQEIVGSLYTSECCNKFTLNSWDECYRCVFIWWIFNGWNFNLRRNLYLLDSFMRFVRSS